MSRRVDMSSWGGDSEGCAWATERGEEAIGYVWEYELDRRLIPTVNTRIAVSVAVSLSRFLSLKPSSLETLWVDVRRNLRPLTMAMKMWNPRGPAVFYTLGPSI